MPSCTLLDCDSRRCARTAWRQIDYDRKLIHIHSQADKQNTERYVQGMPEQFWQWLKSTEPQRPL